MNWLSGISSLGDILSKLNDLIKNNRATKKLLLRELHINLKGFQTAQKSKSIDYDLLLELLKNEQIKKAIEANFTFSTIKSGKIKLKHIKDKRNKRYDGKNCGWLFENIDLKIEDIRTQKKYHKSLDKMQNSNIALQFSNLFFKMKLLADFIND